MHSTRLAVLWLCAALAVQAQPPCRPAPSFAYATYLGGSAFDHARDVAVDGAGNVYVTGGTESADFPATNRIVNSGATEPGVSRYDIFVVKLSPSGSIVWSTRIGGPNYDRAYAIEVAPDGSLFLAGRAGAGFPVTGGGLQPAFKGGAEAAFYGNQDGIVLKLTPDGKQIVWASYFGTEDTEIIRDIAVDAKGDVFLASHRSGGSYAPAVASAFRNTPLGGSDGVLAKVAGDGSRVLWAFYVGGSGNEGAGQPSVRADADGNAYYLTLTSSADALTTPSAYSRRLAGGNDFYLSKWSSGGALLFATYVGGTGNELYETHNLALDSSGNAYIGGTTLSADFPTTPAAFRRTHSGNGGSGTGAGTNYPGDGLIAKVSANGTRLLASTFYGGRYGEAIEGIAIDPHGYVHVTGASFSPDLPATPSAFQSALKGTVNSFYAQFSPDLTALVYGSYLGGARDAGRSMTVDAAGAIYFAGESAAGGFPVQNAQQPRYGGGGDGFLSKFSLNTLTSQPCATRGAVVNAGSYLAGIVPGSLVSIFTSGILGNISGTHQAGAELSSNGTTVRVDGFAAPLLSLSNAGPWQQINFQAPFEIAGRSTVDIEIENNGVRLAVPGVPVLASQPGIFEWAAEESVSSAAVLHQDGSTVTTANPARPGEALSLFLTGGGPLNASIATGALGPEPPAGMTLPAKVKLDGADCPVTFSGYAPGFLGLYQINFEVRPGAPRASLTSLSVQVGNETSPATLIALQ